MNDNQITLKQIQEFSKEYNNDKTNKYIENAITNNGLENACINRDIIIENQPIFNIELPKTKRYDQEASGRCWIFSGLNLIKYNIAENLNIDVNQLELSDNYIDFFDKLEKSNNIYETIINMKNVDYDILNKENIVKYAVSEGGYWELFVAIINKYGLTPYKYNPNAIESKNYVKIDALYTEKVKKDITKLIEAKNKQKDIIDIKNLKNKFLEENYNFLSKILGEPVTKFDFEYKDKDGKYYNYANLTPLDFKNKFLTLKLDDFVVIGNLPMYNKEFYKLYRKKYIGNVYENSYVKFLNLPIQDLKQLTIKQLKDGIPVYMGTHIRKCRDTKTGILDTRLYNYNSTLNFEKLTKEEALNLYDISMHHIMAFTGVNLIDNKPQRWKIEDSYGDKEKVNGYYIMNDNFFNEFVLSVVIDKKYLTEKQLRLLDQEPIEFGVEDPF